MISGIGRQTPPDSAPDDFRTIISRPGRKAVERCFGVAGISAARRAGPAAVASGLSWRRRRRRARSRQRRCRSRANQAAAPTAVRGCRYRSPCWNASHTTSASATIASTTTARTIQPRNGRWISQRLGSRIGSAAYLPVPRPEADRNDLPSVKYARRGRTVIAPSKTTASKKAGTAQQLLSPHGRLQRFTDPEEGVVFGKPKPSLFQSLVTRPL